MGKLLFVVSCLVLSDTLFVRMKTAEDEVGSVRRVTRLY